MKKSPVIFIIPLLLISIGLIIAVYREKSDPEWMVYQHRSFALAAEKLEIQMSESKTSDGKKALQLEIDALRVKRPQLIEVQPFGGKLPTERCLSCHIGIEDTSTSHPNSVFGCVICHGGNGKDVTVKGAHIGLRGGKNPASLEFAGISCGTSKPELGACHSRPEEPLLSRTENVPRSLMATNAGIIGVLYFQWGLTDSAHSRYSIKPVTHGGTSLAAIPDEYAKDGLLSAVNSHFRKFCAACHLRASKTEGLVRMDGCPSCHADYNKQGTYTGGDPTIKRNESGHPSTHTITNAVSSQRCRSCHNRSARIGMNYQGEMESTQYGTPFVSGGLNDENVEGRFFWKLVPDIHHEKGMACIDCHTGQDTMGDGRIHLFMKDQIEIRCEDCHGDYLNPPKIDAVRKHDPLTQTLIRTQKLKNVAEGTRIALTSKNRPIPNVRETEKGLVLTGKLDGKEHPVTVITGKKGAHSIRGHERLECDTCHSAWSPQCYGCHQLLDLQAKGKDHLTGQLTPGRWSEGRSYFRYERNILGINSRGKVGVLVPGCQVWNTILDEKGNVVEGYDSKIMPLKNGLSSIAVGSTHPHTTRKESPKCVDCHLDPKSFGYGEGSFNVRSDSSFQPIYESGKAGLKIAYSLDAITDTSGTPLQSTSHEKARAFTPIEIRKIVSIGPCLPCHDKYDDPVWQQSGPYVLQPACKRALEQYRQQN